MTALTEKQKQYIKKNRRKPSLELARRLRVAETDVTAYLSSIQSQPHKRRKGATKLILAGLPLVLLVLLEVVLRFFNYGPDLAIFETYADDPRYFIPNSSLGRRYVSTEFGAPAISQDAILKRKPANGYRVFVLGGGTAAGFPYLHNGAFSRMLRTRLQDVLPNHHVEVLNLAMPATNSFAILDLAGELKPYAPDALLIYAGHSEFYGALGVGSAESLGPWRGLTRLLLENQHIKTVRFFRDAVAAITSDTAVAGETELTVVTAERMVSRKHIGMHSDVYGKAKTWFAANLGEILESANEAGIAVLIGDLVSNVRDQPPFVSAFKKDIDRAAWNRHFAAGRKLSQASDYGQALSAFQRAAEIDPGVARLSFSIARCYDGLNRFETAQQWYYKARDQDALRLRASEAFNAVIQNAVRGGNAELVSIRSNFEQISPHGLIGENLMLDHVHPNLSGYFLMARSFFDEMVAAGCLPEEADLQARRPESDYWQDVGLTPLDFELANMRTRILKSGWPFKSEADREVFAPHAAEDKTRKLALRILRNQITWEAGHLELAEYYSEQNQLEQAAAEYIALVKARPYKASPYLRLGLIYLETENYGRALDVFTRSLQAEETATAHKWIGSIYANSGRAGKGIPHLRKALAVRRNDPEVLYNLSVALATVGDYQQASLYCRQLLESHPDQPGVRELWFRLKEHDEMP